MGFGDCPRRSRASLCVLVGIFGRGSGDAAEELIDVIDVSAPLSLYDCRGKLAGLHQPIEKGLRYFIIIAYPPNCP
ncbi:MAG: hypothetical protein JRC66_06580 [Deltaproteobacteria bacterium]|nr:hypothetical protein [Deltaproteobacteria bacterium]